MNHPVFNEEIKTFDESFFKAKSISKKLPIVG
jgi:hypothetical protein